MKSFPHFLTLLCVFNSLIGIQNLQGSIPRRHYPSANPVEEEKLIQKAIAQVKSTYPNALSLGKMVGILSPTQDYLTVIVTDRIRTQDAKLSCAHQYSVVFSGAKNEQIKVFAHGEKCMRH